MPTLRDVARLAGVSISTVSHVLNKYDDINEETRQKVLAAIKKLDYHANSMARGLIKNKSSLIGLILFGEGIGHPFFHQVVRGTIDEVEKRDRNAILSTVPHDGYEAAPIFRKMHEHRLEGLIVLGLPEGHAAMARILNSKIPTLFVDAVVEGERIGSIRSDNFRGAFLATDHLLQLGHTRIAFVNEASEAAIFEERFRGYLAAHEKWGVEFNPALYIKTGNYRVEGYRAARELFERDRQVTAIFASSDRLAFGVMDELRRAGLQVPQDVSVVGFDDIELACFANPPLTTVRQNGNLMGERAAKELVAMLEDPEYTPAPILIDTELMVRESTGPVRGINARLSSA
ncbi:MAG: LacI family transcriptional regulator [Firmicutes bacterium]|nr:LacI family transcriptional regulator [Bacillota bacterium]